MMQCDKWLPRYKKGQEKLLLKGPLTNLVRTYKGVGEGEGCN